MDLVLDVGRTGYLHVRPGLTLRPGRGGEGGAALEELEQFAVLCRHLGWLIFPLVGPTCWPE